MIIFDSSYLIAFLHPNPSPPKDAENKPVERFKERIEELVNTLNAEDTLVGVPTPVVAEILVRYPENKSEYLEVLRNRYKFDIMPFGIKAAIEAAELIAMLIAETKQPAEQWAKVKFDIQIVAMAKAEEKLTMLYADDKSIVNNAKRLGIPVVRICDLPLPPVRRPAPIPMIDEAGQSKLFEHEKEADAEVQAVEGQQEIVAQPGEVRGRAEGSAGDTTGAPKAEEKNSGESAAKPAVILSETPKPADKGGLGKGGS